MADPLTHIRAADIADLSRLREIERSAGEIFRDIGMAAIADDEPPTVETLARHQSAGLAWVAVDTDDQPVAYLTAEPIDRNWHIEQVSVHADHARRGIGRVLLEHTARRAMVAGTPALTLTTFADVPWNAPYYERLGFHRLPDATLAPGLRAIRRHETELGLDAWPRVAMRRDLGPG
ncbi:GNAT family N-acetyltransferase [Amycolatopsis sp. GM8]|uniref:GNAT family N-acetyltransferase n=1 Tax=Amycolatopsis sp. GM8 TaxID=2896530 RepID=UPI001F39FE1E|nr:GNAT family N-acetyltransferase [Amycolatopsis sp. GM8]